MLLLLASGLVYAQTYTVKAVLDGETLMLTNGEIVHLIGVEIPKVQAKEGNFLDGYSSDEPSEKSFEDARRLGVDVMTLAKMGQEATEFIKWIKGYEVNIEFDVQERDKYGRLLGYVYWGCVKKDPDDLTVTSFYDPTVGDDRYYNYSIDNQFGGCRFINATIIKSGYATPMTIPPNVKYADLFKELYEEAREQKRGLWKEDELIIKKAYYGTGELWTEDIFTDNPQKVF